MHRSSDSIAAIASALAKAQTALVNPEKTMTATIRDDRRGEGAGVSFRYAPLSSGLEIIRKALGQHEIAVVQTTALDDATKMMRLNTVLAHSSGEWIASDWPICPLSDMASPQRTGAALTYARRYGLFTLVGIAGEDDLDAPDLHATCSDLGSAVPPSRSGYPGKRPHPGNGKGTVGHAHGAASSVRQTVLSEPESATLRETMLAEISGLGSTTATTSWASDRLRAKNTLTAGDARLVEAAFEARLLTLDADDLYVEGPQAVLPSDGNGIEALTDKSVTPTATDALGDDVPRPIGRAVRHRNKEHLRFVRTQPCLICGRQPSDPHHLKFAQPRALGRKVSDEFAVPLCRVHHHSAHRAGDERAWWDKMSIDPVPVARKLWQQTREGNGLDRDERPERPAPPEGVNA